MRSIKFDPEIIYVQKLYFFLYLLIFCVLASAILFWRLGWRVGTLAFTVGFLIAYLTMVRKREFTVARFSSQLYYYFNEPRQALSLLEKFLSTNDPLLCATLADILLKEGRPKQALSILRENPHVLADPLLLATQGHILKHLGRTQDAVKMYERSLRLASENGFPHNGANWLTQKFLTISYTACIHHSLGDCYTILKDSSTAKRHYWAGNRRLIDITFWKYPHRPFSRSPKNYSESR